MFPRVPEATHASYRVLGMREACSRLTLRTDALKPQKQSLGLNLLFKVVMGRGAWTGVPQWLPNQEAGLVWRTGGPAVSSSSE